MEDGHDEVAWHLDVPSLSLPIEIGPLCSDLAFMQSKANLGEV